MNFESFCLLVEKESQENLRRSDWVVSENARLKFSKDGTFKEFIGDTVVLPVEGKYLEIFEKYQYYLYENLGELLAERLPVETFHMTVHDLSNQLDTPKNINFEKNSRMCKEIFGGLRAFKEEIINMSMVGTIGDTTAVGISLAPEDEKSFRILMELHHSFDKIRTVEKFIPHVTLGYFLPVEFPRSKVKGIIDFLRSFSSEIRGERVTFRISELSYQMFEDMKSYFTVFKLSDLDW